MAISSSQASKLLQKISDDPHVNVKADKTILIEEQYPIVHHVILAGSDVETSMATIQTILELDVESQTKLSKEIRNQLAADQKSTIETYGLDPTVDMKWTPLDYTHWVMKVTTIVVSAVRESLMRGSKKDDNDATKLLFAGSVPDMAVKSGEVKNLPGLTICDEILLEDPWISPGNDELKVRIKAFLKKKKNALYRQVFHDEFAYIDGVTQKETATAKAKYLTLCETIEETLKRLYKINSHTFHVFLRHLIPGATTDKSHLFTRILENRNRHFNHNRVLKDADADIIPYSAKTTIDFIGNNFVQENDDRPVIDWNKILMHTRFPGVSLYKWIFSFDVLLRHYLQSIKKSKPSKLRSLRLRQCIGAQLSDFERSKLSEYNGMWDGSVIADGKYVLQTLKTAVANIENKLSMRKYVPPKRVKTMIIKRAKDHSSDTYKVEVPSFATKSASEESEKRSSSTKRDRDTAFFEQDDYDSHEHYAFEGQKPFVPCTTPVCVEKGWHKRHSLDKCWQVHGKPTSRDTFAYNSKGGRGKGLDNHPYPKGGRGKGKSSPYGKGKSPKGKGKNSKGKRADRSRPYPVLICDFCQENHSKTECERYYALQNKETYYNFTEGKDRSEMYVIDLLENAVDTENCGCCLSPWCNGQDCTHPVDALLFQKTSASFVKEGLWDLVSAAKTGTSLSSHPPVSKDTLLFNSGSSSIQEEGSWGQGHVGQTDSEVPKAKSVQFEDKEEPPPSDEDDLEDESD